MSLVVPVEKIPVILVTGFLGSGKTTFLRHLAESHPELRLLFLVNEFASSGIDEETLKNTGLPTQSVVGGSLFCECKAGEFIKVMRERVLSMHRHQNLDAVIIETSGIADPEAIGNLMFDHGLDENFQVKRIVTIVSPLNFHKLLKGLPVMEAQIRTSDLVILNKTDIADDVIISSVTDTIGVMNPEATIRNAVHCAIEFSLEGNLPKLPSANLSTCDANPFSVEEVEISSSLNINDLRDRLNQLPPEILRAKGRVHLDGTTWSIEKTVDTLDIRSTTGSGSSNLILIAHDENKDLLKATAKVLI